MFCYSFIIIFIYYYMLQITPKNSKTQSSLTKVNSQASLQSTNGIPIPQFGKFFSRPLTSSRSKLNVIFDDVLNCMPLYSQHSTTLNSVSQLNSERFFMKKPDPIAHHYKTSKSPAELFLRWDKEDLLSKVHSEHVDQQWNIDRYHKLYHISPPKSGKITQKRQSFQQQTHLQTQQAQIKLIVQKSQKRYSDQMNQVNQFTIKQTPTVSVKIIPPKIIEKTPMEQFQETDYFVQQKDVDSVSKKLQIDPLELKEMYDEIIAANKKIDLHVKDNVNFFNDLFDDGQFEKWLKVDRHILSQKELSFAIETLVLKQELIQKRMKIDVVDFETLDSILSKLAFFERFTKSTRINILKLATYIKVEPGEYVFYQNDYGDNLYVILSGSITVKVNKEFDDKTSVKQIVTSLYDGQQFGELAMMETKQKGEEVVLEEKLQGINIASMREVKETLQEQSRIKKFLEQQQDEVKENSSVRQFTVEISNSSGQSNLSYKQGLQHQQRQASIQASETCHLLTMGRDNFKNILMVLMQDELETKIKMLKSLRFFQDVQPFVLIPLANQLIQNTYGLDHVIVREKELLDRMYIIHKGSCNVVRQIITERQVIPNASSRGSLKALPNFVFGEQKLSLNEPRMFPSEKIEHFDIEQNEDAIDKIGDKTIIMQDDKKVIYQQTFVYRKLQEGDIIFGRALTGLTLEGLEGQDHARMTIVSSSQNTVLYSISLELLTFCPIFLKDHLINYLLTLQDADLIQAQPLNKELKRLNKLITKKQNQSEAEKEVIKQQLLKLKKQQNLRIQLRQNVCTVKLQKEVLQDDRNNNWEIYKQQLNTQSVQHQSITRGRNHFKKY